MLLVLLQSAACGKERSPWTGFDLFPPEEAPADGSESADTVSTAQPDTQPATPSGAQVQTAGMGSVASVANGTPAAGQMTASPGAASAAGSGARATVPSESTSGGTPVGMSETTAAQPEAPPKAFRITELQLRDPHIFAGTQDLTEQEVLGQSVNRTLIPAKLTKDADGDGALDVSVIVLMRPFAPDAAADRTPELSLVDASCPVNSSSSAPCKPLNGSTGLQASWLVEQRQSGSCLAPEPGTTSNYQPAVTIPSAPCFQSADGKDLTMDVGGIKIKVTAAQVSATYQADPPALVKGLLAGYVTETAAMEAKLPSDAGPTVAGDSLSTYIRQRDYDRDSSPTGEDGFWMYMNFVAKPIDYEP